jgi:hypothetical protein
LEENGDEAAKTQRQTDTSQLKTIAPPLVPKSGGAPEENGRLKNRKQLMSNQTEVGCAGIHCRASSPTMKCDAVDANA